MIEAIDVALPLGGFYKNIFLSMICAVLRVKVSDHSQSIQSQRDFSKELRDMNNVQRKSKKGGPVGIE